MTARKQSDLDLELAIGSVFAMANVTAIVVEAHLKEMEYLKEAPITAANAMNYLESGAAALSFSFYPLKGMISDLQRQFSTLVDHLASAPAGSRRRVFLAVCRAK